MAPEEILQLFNLNLVLLNTDELKTEKDHLEKIILAEAAKALARARPEIAHWLKQFPKHHAHPYDHLPLPPLSCVLHTGFKRPSKMR